MRLLLRVKRTSVEHSEVSAFNPKRTLVFSRRITLSISACMVSFPSSRAARGRFQNSWYVGWAARGERDDHGHWAVKKFLRVGL